MCTSFDYKCVFRKSAVAAVAPLLSPFLAFSFYSSCPPSLTPSFPPSFVCMEHMLQMGFIMTTTNSNVFFLQKERDR